MKKEVKNRIEQIRQGIVPKGYKKTRHDIVPEEWEEKQIGQYICEFTEKTTVANQYPVLTSARKGLMFQTDYYSNRQVTTENNIGYNVLPYGYITFRSRSDDGRFRFNQNRLIDRGIISYFYPVFSFKSEVCTEYMLQLLNHSIFRRMYPYCEGTAQQVLSIKKLGHLEYALPRKEEQQRIAEIFAAQDKIIKLKEKRLFEKQQQKKSLMQHLLTGKIRMPGFDEKWQYIKLGKLVTKQKIKNSGFQYSLVLSNSAQHGIIPQTDQFDKEIANDERIDGYYIVRDGFFVYNPRISVTAPCGPINMNELGTTGVMSPLYTVFSISSDLICKNYLKQYFQSSCWHKYMKSVANYGARHDRMNVSDEDFFLMPIPVPCSEEQSEIGTILSTADKEIELLRLDVEQEKKKKNALMQLLLTGIVRVHS